MSSDVEETIFENTLDAVENVLDLDEERSTCSYLIYVMLNFWPMVSKLSFLMKSILYFPPFPFPPSFPDCYFFAPVPFVAEPTVVYFFLSFVPWFCGFVCFIYS